MSRDIKNMTFSGLHRYAVIVETVLCSDDFLSPADRLELIQTLLDDMSVHTSDQVNSACRKYAENMLEENMINSQILRSAIQG